MIGKLLLTATIITLLPLHELPDGRVDTGLTAKLADGQLELKYQLDINDRTLAKALKGWKIKVDDDSDLDKLFLEHAGKNLNSSLKLTVDGKAISVPPGKTELAARHHLRFLVHFKVTDENLKKPKKLTVKELTFSELKKSVRVAAITRGNDNIAKTNCAELLVRADRADVWKLSKKTKMISQTILILSVDSQEKIEEVESELGKEDSAKSEIESESDSAKQSQSKNKKESNPTSAPQGWTRHIPLGVAVLFLGIAGIAFYLGKKHLEEEAKEEAALAAKKSAAVGTQPSEK